MLSRIDLAYEMPRILYALYWVMADVLSALEEAAGKVNERLRFHFMLASKRCNIIVEHLRLALEETGIKIDERLGEEELRRRIGALPIETLKNFRSTIKRLINELASSEGCNASWLSSKLMEFADIICVASGMLKALSDSLKESRDEHIWRICLILQAVAQDLEVITNTHRYLTSNPEMLARDVKLSHDP
ncbi:MAG: hypothetical protein QXS05_09435 [Candidatus Bathyarchaeia archaeon]